MDLEFMILDTFDSMRPRKAPKIASLEEANKACAKILKAEAEFNRKVDFYSPESVAQASISIEVVADIISMYCNNEQLSPSQDSEVTKPEEPAPIVQEQPESETKDLVNEQDREEIEKFDNEFEMMMQESTNDARKGLGPS